MTRITKAQWWEIHTKAWIMWWSNKQILHPILRVAVTPLIPLLLLAPGEYYHYQHKSGLIIKPKRSYWPPVAGIAAWATMIILLITQWWLPAGLLGLVAIRYGPSIGSQKQAKSVNADYVASDLFAIPGNWQAGKTLISDLLDDRPGIIIAFNPKGSAKRERYYKILGAQKQPNGLWTLET